MKFCTVINCIDGRVQLPAIEYLKKRFEVDYVDNITEPAPVLILGIHNNEPYIHYIKNQIQISIEKHYSVGIAVVAHHDCARNPVDKKEQLKHLRLAVIFLREEYSLPVIGLWVDESWTVHEML